jgi:benzoyl-CoA 2,3-dioxygenase component A
VQDLLREQSADITAMLQDANTCFYVCGLKSMEEGVLHVLRDIANEAGLGWDVVAPVLKREGRLHLETY